MRGGGGKRKNAGCQDSLGPDWEMEKKKEEKDTWWEIHQMELEKGESFEWVSKWGGWLSGLGGTFSVKKKKTRKTKGGNNRGAGSLGRPVASQNSRD